MKRRIAVRGICFNSGKLLSVLHKDDEGVATNFWSVPGGGLDPGEEIVAGLKREMIEETGIAPEIGRLLFVQQFTGTISTGQQIEGLEFFFEIKNTQDYQTIDLSATSHGEIELAAIEWMDPKETNILPAFLQTYDIGDHITANKPVYFYSQIQK